MDGKSLTRGRGRVAKKKKKKEKTPQWANQLTQKFPAASQLIKKQVSKIKSSTMHLLARFSHIERKICLAFPHSPEKMKQFMFALGQV